MSGDRVKAAVMTEFGKIEVQSFPKPKISKDSALGENEDVRHLRHG